MNAAPIRIMLVDDHAVVRAGFRRLLEQRENIHVVAEADTGQRAYALFVEQVPDVVVLDLSMPGVSGLEIIRRIIARESAAKILVFSMHEDASLAERAIQLGARGYVTKSNAPEVLAAAVVEVAAGRIFVSEDVGRAIAMLKLESDNNPMTALTAREFEIFRLLVSGQPVSAIAAILNLSSKTVANYHTMIKQKLGIASDVEMVLMALRHNLFEI